MVAITHPFFNPKADGADATIARPSDWNAGHVFTVSATARFVGRITAGSGLAEELTGTQATTLLDQFTTTLKGVVPGSGGGTTNFLRADGTWAAPASGGLVVGSTAITSGSSGNFLYNNANVLGERTPTQATAALDTFTSALKGLTPASGGGTSNFLRADGNWAAPAGGGNVTGPGSSTDNAVVRWDGTAGTAVQNSGVLVDDSSNLIPGTTDGASLGTLTGPKLWSDLFLAPGAVINWNSGEATLNNNGSVLAIGSATTTTYNAINPLLHVIATGSQAAIGLARFSADNGPPRALFAKSRSASPGGLTIVVDGDPLGQLYFTGADGGSFIPACLIAAEVDGAPGSNDMPGRLIFATTADNAASPTERMRIDNAGKVVIGGAAGLAAYEGGAAPLFQINAAASNAGFGVSRFTNNANPAKIYFSHSRGATVGDYTVVQNGDFLGQLRFEGSDGTNFAAGAMISVVVDGTPGGNDMPSALIFGTSSEGTESADERMRIRPDGTIARLYREEESAVALTDGASVALNAALGNVFHLTAAGDRTISVPTNAPASGRTQKIIIRHEASAADRTLTLTTGSAGAFRFGTDITGLTATTSGLADYIGCVWNQADDRWDVVSYIKGF